MSDLITADEATKLLDEATPGPWEADGDPWNRIIWSSAENRVCFMAHSNGLDDARDIATSNLVAAAPDLARTVIALHAQLADAQAAQAMVVERCAEVMDQKWFIEDSMRDAIKAEIRALAPASGVEALAALRAENKRLTDAVIDAEAERDILAAANAVLEAKVAGLAEALKKADTALSDEGYRETQWPRPQIRAALATQEAGNAQSTPPISPEEAQFNAVRYHERFGPLDEKGNPVDPRRRG